MPYDFERQIINLLNKIFVSRCCSNFWFVYYLKLPDLLKNDDCSLVNEEIKKPIKS